MCGEVGRSFDVTVGLKHGCVMSPWLFNLLMDEVVIEWKAIIMNAGDGLNMTGMEDCVE